MSYRIEFLKKARHELIEAWTWYEDRQEGLDTGLLITYRQPSFQLNKILNITKRIQKATGKPL